MTTWHKIMQGALDALDVPSGGRGGSQKSHNGRGGGIQRRSGGTLVELLAEPATVSCPKCGADCGVPRLHTRRRRLVQVVAGGRVLSVEIEP